MYFRSFFPSFSKTLVLLVWLSCPTLLLVCSSLGPCLTYVPASAATVITPPPSPPSPAAAAAAAAAAAVVPPSSARPALSTLFLYVLVITVTSRADSATKQTGARHLHILSVCISIRTLKSLTLLQGIEPGEACVLFHFPPARWGKFGLVVIRKWILPR